MKKNYPNFILICLCFILGILTTTKTYSQSFDQSQLDFNGNGNVSNGVTSMMFGPDGRLYVAEYPGLIKILTITRNTSTDYEVVAMEVLDGIQTMADHNDDGTLFSSVERETTGLTIGGTDTNPVIYVASSDFRIGAGAGGGNGDVDLDTNSGVITRFTWNGSSWDVVDIVRGLPRSEENHATNGLELATINGTDYLIVASGGITNAGSPSTNFVYTCEYALSGAILSIDLDALDALPTLNDNGRQYIYDLPTLDDPTRANVNGIDDPDTPGYTGVDVNDPWGGNDGLNQAIIVPGGPVQVYSPGYRNAYDIVLTESGALYATDNGANSGWGGFPIGEGTANVTNELDPDSDPPSGTVTAGPTPETIDNKDHLQLITTDVQTYVAGSFYGGHPNPTRANPNGAGLFTAPGVGLTGAVFRTQIYDPDGSTPGSTTDPSIGLPANWPPVAVANSVEGDFRGPTKDNPEGPDDDPVVVWGTNTNGIDEYTATNFGGAMQGNLLAGDNNGIVRRVELNASGGSSNFTANFLSGIGGNPLGITCNSDDEIFPGTIWTGTLNGLIVVFEPQDFLNCTEPGEPGYDPMADGDFDGYLNQDEEDNGTQVCNGGSQPDDFDAAAGGALVSDLNDTDDDADGISDALDPFQLGNPTTSGSDAFTIPVFNGLFNDQQGLGGIFGLGMTGLMNNGDTGNNWLDWLDVAGAGPNPDDVLGGAPGIMTSHMTDGTALGTSNDQDKGYQYGVQVDNTTGVFTVIGGMNGFTGNFRLYENTQGVTNGELGFFIGDGTQSNYIKFVATTDGFTALQEINDVPGTPVTTTIATGDRPDSGILFYFVIDPATGIVNMEYQIDGGARTLLGSITAQGSVLQAIQSNTLDLAVGFTGSSNTPGLELEGSWDFLNVLAAAPTLVQEIPDVEVIIGSPDQQIDLDTHFADDNGVGNLAYTVEGNTDPTVGTSISGNILSLSFPLTVASSTITIRATDADMLFVEDQFVVDVLDGNVVLYRVNSGGPEIMAVDGSINWEEDTPTNNSQFLSVPGTNDDFSGDVSSVDGSVDGSTTPFGLFATERFDDDAGAPNMTYSFPVGQAGNYEVRLYMGNGFSGTSQAGQRLFEVTIEGKSFPLLDEIDLSGTYGHEVGTMITHTLAVTDGSIDIQFLHGAAQNPLVNAIEILDALDSDTPIYVFPIEDQFSNAGEDLDGSFSVEALGGDANLSYMATGLPPGVDIEPTDGLIFGTIDANAFTNSPYNVTITVDDSDASNTDQVTINFTWVVVEPFLFRINAGGLPVDANDNEIDWEGNAINGAQTGVNYAVNTGVTDTYNLITATNRSSTIPAYIDNATLATLFGDERFDQPNGDEMEYTLDVENGEYVVNLYMGNSFENTNQVGDRVFDILLEGNTAENDLDLVATFGHQVGGMLSYPVTVSDGQLNIEFIHEVENPLVNAIEVYFVDSGNPTLTLNAISDQNNGILDEVDFNAIANGGDSNFELTYFMVGAPEGITIDPVTGQISGTLAVAAASGGPNGDGIHNVVVTAIRPRSAPATQEFTWGVITQALWIDKDEDENYTARHESSFVQAGDRFYHLGGREESRTIDIYDYEADSWTALVDSAPLSFNHFQAIEYQGLIWVIGAFNTAVFPNEVPAEHVWMFNPATQEWIEGPEVPVSRRRGSAGLVLYNDKFYLAGGNDDGHDGGFVAQFDEFDPATGVWTTLTDMPRARDHFAAVVIGDKLYAAGGRQSGGAGGFFDPLLGEVDVYDFNTESWSTLPTGQNIPTPRAGGSAVNFDNKLIVIGGEVRNELVYGENVDDALKITEQYDPVTESWVRLPDMNFERHGFQAIVSGPGVHVTGGSPRRGGGNQLNMEVFGEDAPVGAPSVESALVSPDIAIIQDGQTVDIDLQVIDGNVGVFIQSMEITGADAADFNIETGELTNVLLNPNSTHTLSVSLSGTGADRTAVLTINYDDTSTLNIVLTNNENAEFGVTNPGDQFNYEGDVVSLQIEATSPNTTSYSATGLPPDLTINPNTGVISGTIDDGFIPGNGGDDFREEDGLVIIEMESGNTSGWGITNLDGETGIIANTNSFSTQNGTTIPYEITISEAGVYRFNWNSFYTGTNPTEENDNWLRLPNNDDVWFFAIDNPSQNPGTEADIIANLQGAQTDIVFPGGSSRITPGTTPNGQTSNGYFKVFRSGGTGEVYDWQARTSDNDPHNIFVWFVNPGTYTLEVSERSAGHAIDRMALFKVDTYGFNLGDNFLNSQPESPQGTSSSGPGAADNSPYNVSVTVTDDGNPPGDETIEFVWYVGEDGDLIAVPQADVIEGTVQLTVNFTGSNSLDDVGVTEYLWDFKDGTTSTLADPVHTFETTGVFEVDLTVTDADTNTDTKSITITVNGTGIGPTAVASAIPTEGEAPLEVVFDGSASTDDVAIVSYDWDFIDGGTSTEVSPTYTFITPGIYEVMLTVTDVEGLTDTDIISITVNQPNLPPLAVAEATPLNGEAPLEVTFTGSNSTDDNGVVEYAWDFGDGNTSIEANPVHTYTIPGSYEAVLTVTDAGALSDMASISIIVNDEANEVPTAVALANPTEGPAPLPVIFNGSQSTDDKGIVSYQWDFMDGTTSEEINPVTTFELPGVYNVTLTVADEEGLTNTATVVITVNPGNEAPEAVASATPLSGDAPLEVSFTGEDSTDDVQIVSYLWDFMDGATSTEMNPVHTYTAPGSYEVVLTVTDGEGATDMATVLITVNTPPGNEAPTAIATATPLSGVVPLEVTFNGENSTDDKGIVSFLWDFADGTTSSETNPVHTYNAVGVYEVTLTVTDEEGLTGTDTVTITVTEEVVNEAPVAVIAATPIDGTVPLEVTFTGSNSTDDVGIVSYAWDFGNGDSSTESDPVYVFEVAGTYEVSLTVTDAEGLTNSNTITIVVFENEPSALDDEVVIAPNPAGGVDDFAYVYVAPEVSVVTINLHDSSGRLIASYNANDPVIQDTNRYQIPVFGLRSELYFITVETNNGEPIAIPFIVDN